MSREWDPLLGGKGSRAATGTTKGRGLGASAGRGGRESGEFAKRRDEG